MKMYLSRLLLISILLVAPQSANADLADWLGLRQIAEDAGRSAAEVLVKGADLSTRNLAMMTNQFGLLVADFYGDDPTKAARAKKILEGVFGRTLTKTDDVKLQVTAAFSGDIKGSDGLCVDIWPFANLDHEALKKIAEAGASFHGTPIIAATAPGNTIASVQEKVLKRSKAFISRGKSGRDTYLDVCNKKYPGDKDVPGPGVVKKRSKKQEEEYASCLIEEAAQDLTSAIMQVFSMPDIISSRSSATRDLPGGRFVALVVSKQALEKLKDRLSITVWLHQAGDPNKRIGVFREVIRTIDPVDMLKNIVHTPKHAAPELCYEFIDLKLDAIMGSAYLANPTIFK